MKYKLIAFAVFALVFAGASMAAAEEVTPASYKDQVEPICQANTEANEKILKGVRELVKKDKLDLAGSQFSKASVALKKAYRQLKAVPQPPADKAKLEKWLSYVKQEAELFNSGAKALKAGNKTKAQSVVVRLSQTANLANSQVLSFGFHYCKLQPSKFT